jgi:hypothetical protein
MADDTNVVSDEAAQRRAARKAARAAILPPERNISFDHLSLEDLRALRTELMDQETRVSYWRRIIQARLDVLRSDVTDHSPVTDLAKVLTEATSAHRRLAHISVLPIDDIPPLPDLAEVWARQVEPGDTVATAKLVTDLESAEEQLSKFRSELFRGIDVATNELIARYREQPLLALQILPTDPFA